MDTAANSYSAYACDDPAAALGKLIEDTIVALVDANNEGDQEAAELHRDRLAGLRQALAFTPATSAVGRLAHAREAQRLTADLTLAVAEEIDAKGLEPQMSNPLVFLMTRICEGALAAAEAP